MKREGMHKEDRNNLLHAVINQIETDFNDNDYESLDELITQLMEDDNNRQVLINYLSDSAKKNWMEGSTHKRY